MKLKTTLALAAALAFTASANASMIDYSETGAGTIQLSLVNTAATMSAMFDLGIDTNSFVAGAYSKAGTLITWNLNTGTVGGNTTLAGNVTGSWSAAWDAYKANAVVGVNTSRFGVWGGDNDLNGNTGGAGRRLVSTANSTGVSMTNAQLSNALGASQTSYIRASDLLGNHAAVANGANTATSGGAYEAAPGGAAQNFGGAAGNINPTQVIGQAAYLLQIEANGISTSVQTTKAYFGNPTLDLNLDGKKDYATFNFDAASGVLTYAVAAAPVPEPTSLALMLAGLAGVGFLAHRRRAA